VITLCHGGVLANWQNRLSASAALTVARLLIANCGHGEITISGYICDMCIRWMGLEKFTNDENLMRAGHYNRQITIERKAGWRRRNAIRHWKPFVWVPLVALARQARPVAERFPTLRFRTPCRAGLKRLTQGLASGGANQSRWQAEDGVMTSTPAWRVTVHGDTDVIYSIVGGPAEVGGLQSA